MYIRMFFSWRRRSSSSEAVIHPTYGTSAGRLGDLELTGGVTMVVEAIVETYDVHVKPMITMG